MLMDSGWTVVIGSLLAVLLLSQIGLWAVAYQVVQQQGRMLLRFDELGHAPAYGLELPVVEAAGHAQPSGPAVGDVVAPFRLPDLSGQEVALEDVVRRGKRPLL